MRHAEYPVQVNSALNSFASNFVTALNPQIMKSYAQNDRAYMLMYTTGSSFVFLHVIGIVTSCVY